MASRKTVYSVKKDGGLRVTTIDKALATMDEDDNKMTAGVLFEMFDVRQNSPYTTNSPFRGQISVLLGTQLAVLIKSIDSSYHRTG